MSIMLPEFKTHIQNLGIEVKDAAGTRYNIMERGPDAEPSIVTLPENTTQFEQAVNAHIKFQIPLAIIAGGTGLAGAQRSEGEPYIDIQRLTQLQCLKFADGTELKFSKKDLDLDPESQANIWKDQLTKFISDKKFESQEEKDKFFAGAKFSAEAGLSLGSVNHVLAPAGIFLPFDAGSNKIGNATLGGLVSLYSAGADVGSFGTPADSCTHLKYINASGVIGEETGPSGAKRQRQDDQPYLSRDKLLFGNSAIGSEGTFRLISEVEFVTTPVPKQRHVFVLPFDSKEEVMAFRDQMTAHLGEDHIRQFEILNGEAVKMAQTNSPAVYSKVFGDAGLRNYYVMLDVKDNAKFDPENNIGLRLYEHLSNSGKVDGKDFYPFGDLTKMSAADDSQPTASISIPHDLRHTMSEISKTIAVKYAIAAGSKNSAGDPEKYEHMLTLDVCTPKSTYVRCMQKIEDFFKDEFGVTPKEYGHGVVNAAHVHYHSEEPLSSPYKDGMTKREYIVDKAYAILIEELASCSSEHGIGQLYANAWQNHADKNAKVEWIAQKLDQDPNNLFHPHSNNMDKLITLMRSKEGDSLRQDVLSFAKDNDLNNAVEVLNSFGKRTGQIKE